MATAEHVDRPDREQAIEYSLAESRLIAGTAHPFAEDATRAFYEGLRPVGWLFDVGELRVAGRRYGGAGCTR